jgi:hypothetical protein
MRISKPATALVCIAAIAALASASLSKTVPADRAPSSEVAAVKQSRNLPLPAASGFNPFDDAAPMK